MYWHPFSGHFTSTGWMPVDMVTPRIGTTPEGSECAKVNLSKKAQAGDAWAFNDLVEVPETLEPCHYVLSFRWDCQATPQEWNTFENIKIV